jgi:methylmalonyl-CoA epimerase
MGNPHLPEVVSVLHQNIVRVDHIAIAVENLEVSIEWYTKVLGFTLVERRTTHGECTAMVSAVVKTGDCTFVLLQGTSADSQINRFIDTFGPGVQHIALQVRSLETALKSLRALGVEPDTQVMADGPLQQIFLPRTVAAGVRIELIERNGGTFSDRNITRLFRTFEAEGLI